MANSELTPRYAILVSPTSSGSNMRAIYAEMPERVALVVADRRSAKPFEFTTENNIPVHVARFRLPEGMTDKEYRDQYSADLADALNEHKIDVAVMAGFNRILNRPFLERFTNPLINVHPGAIPDDPNIPFVFEGVEYPWNQGMMTEDAVANFMDKPYGISTVHIATEIPDFGPVIERVMEKRLPDDSVDSLYARLKVRESEGLIRALQDPSKLIR